MTEDELREWARNFWVPFAPPCCGHACYDTVDNQATCRDCGHAWTVHCIDISDTDYYSTLALVASRLRLETL